MPYANWVQQMVDDLATKGVMITPRDNCILEIANETGCRVNMIYLVVTTHHHGTVRHAVILGMRNAQGYQQDTLTWDQDIAPNLYHYTSNRGEGGPVNRDAGVPILQIELDETEVMDLSPYSDFMYE